MATKPSTTRRKFLTTLGVGGAAAAAIAVSKTPAPAPRTPNQPAAPSKGYQLSEHVRNYYRTAKV